MADAMLKDKSFEAGSLFKRIELAAEAGLITRGMALVAHDVRLGANDERQVDINAEIATSEDAQRSFDFAEALAAMIFILPVRKQPNHGLANHRLD